ncbi:hypothetical protein ACIQPS_36700 [Streptomyces sp. NPDC091290]|uniref:hypothetical protein n=1 Tax=Streptomyces sp. NPDC091290 TaxID=3365990 RepID=UPI003812649A
MTASQHPAALYPDIAAKGILATALQAVADWDGLSVHGFRSHPTARCFGHERGSAPDCSGHQRLDGRTALADPRVRVIPGHGSCDGDTDEMAQIMRAAHARRIVEERVVTPPHRKFKKNAPDWYEEIHERQRKAHSSRRIRVEHSVAHLKNWRALTRHLGRREHMSDIVQAVPGLLSHQQTIDQNPRRTV